MDDDDYSSSPTTLGSCCNDDPQRYAFSGKLMLISVLLFFLVCFLIAFFHLHANRFLLRRARRRFRRRQIPASSIAAVSSSQGLDPSVIKSLPVFVYDAEFHNPPMECPVCLAEFENGETGRVLAKCNHCFHCECIDMWFQSHCSCPICRAPIQPFVKPIEVTENNQSELEGEDEVVIIVAESATDEVQNCELSSSESVQSDDGKSYVGMIVIVAN